MPLPSKVFLLVLFLLRSAPRLEVTRAQAANFLWPDAPDSQTNLRQLFNRLRPKQSEPAADFIQFDRTNVRLDRERLDVDFTRITELVRSVDWSNCGELLDLYRDGLLHGTGSTKGDLSVWLEGQRTEIGSRVVTAIAELLERPDAEANAQTARSISARLLEIDPYQEAAYRALMRWFAANGLHELVTITFEKCRTVLARDHRSAPHEKTLALYRSLARPIAEDDADAEHPRARLAGRASLPRLVLLSPSGKEVDRESWSIAQLVLDEVTVGLCSLRTISVVASHTSWRLSGGALDDTAARRYDIGYVLETDVRRREEGSWLSVRLFGARKRDILWAETYVVSPQTSEEFHRRLSVGLMLALTDAVERAEVARFAKEQNPQAYYWHLIGQKHLRNMDLPNVRRAAGAFKKSLAADPEFAPGHSGRARSVQREWLILGRGDTALLDAAEQSGTRAVNLDFRDGRGYRELGLCSLYRRRWDDAIANFTEAERLIPQYADLISDFGDTLGHCGEPEKGLVKVARAMELNPIPPDQYWWNAAGLQFQLRQYEEAIASVRRMEHPLPALRIAAAAWAYLGDRTQAAQCAGQFLESYPDFRIDHWLSIVPNRNPDDDRHYELGLRKAGFH